MTFKILLCTLSLFLSTGLNSLFAQEKHEKFLFKTFKKIHKTDQSHIKNNKIRDSLILINYRKIKILLNSDVNINTNQELKKRTKDKLEWGLIMTFLHILQTDPNLLLNEKDISFFERKIQEGQISNRELRIAITFFGHDIRLNRFPQWNQLYNDSIDVVKEKWRIESINGKM